MTIYHILSILILKYTANARNQNCAMVHRSFPDNCLFGTKSKLNWEPNIKSKDILFICKVFLSRSS